MNFLLIYQVIKKNLLIKIKLLLFNSLLGLKSENVLDADECDADSYLLNNFYLI